jgi:dienelactone hydrolase
MPGLFACDDRRMLIVAAVALWGELAAGPHHAGFRLIDAQSAAGSYGAKTRAIEVAIWYPAQASKIAPMTFGDYVNIADDLRRREGSPGDLDSPMHARRDAAAAKGTFPIVMWGARYGTTAAQALLSEYLATHGYVVAFARPKETREVLPFEAKTPAEKLDELDAQTDDIRGAVNTVRELPFADGNRVAVITWSYAGESAVRTQQADARVRVVIGLDANVRSEWVYAPEALAAFDSAPRVPYVVYRKREAPFEKLTHGDFNFIQGAKTAYVSVVREVKKTLDQHLGRTFADPKPIEIKSEDLIVTADVYRAKQERGCIALFHQSGSSRGEHRSIGPALAAQGFTAVAADLRWGRRDRWNEVWNDTARRTGTIEIVDRGEREKFEAIRQNAKREARATLHWLRKNCEGPLIVLGSSIHANAALDLAVNEEIVNGVIALSPGEYSQQVPDMMRKLVANLRKPVLVIWARDEAELSPPTFDAIPEGKKVSFASSGRHGAATLFEDPRAWRALRAWLATIE